MALAQELLDCFSRMDDSGLGRILHPNARHSAPGSDFGAQLVGRANITEYFRVDVFPSFKQVKFEPVYTWEDPAKSAVIVEWRSHLYPKTGKNYSNSGVFVIEMKDQLIYWVREYFDTEKAHEHVND
jgi:ketosteroid isomerase-like protein